MKDTKFYSQAGQDEWVLSYFSDDTIGFFLDIGAYDGVYYSNTKILEESGWTGICVEADPSIFQDLLMSRTTLLVNKAIVSDPGIVQFHSEGVSGSVRDDGEITIEGITMSGLFADYNVPNLIQYMSLDIEGGEVDALKSFPFDTHTCVLITVEHNLYLGNTKQQEEINEILTGAGYIRKHKNVEHLGYPFEDWYVHSDY